jgi:hypothetical protein
MVVIMKKKTAIKLIFGIATTGLLVKIIDEYVNSRVRVVTRLERATRLHDLQERKVKEKLSRDQIKRRAEANELDGFPTNAQIES